MAGATAGAALALLRSTGRALPRGNRNAAMTVGAIPTGNLNRARTTEPPGYDRAALLCRARDRVVPCQEVKNLGTGHCLAEQVALRFMTAKRSRGLTLLDRFDALDDGGDVQALRQIADRPDDGFTVPTDQHVLHE